MPVEEEKTPPRAKKQAKTNNNNKTPYDYDNKKIQHDTEKHVS